MKFSPILTMIFSYFIVITFLRSLLPLGWFLHYLFLFFVAFFIPKLTKTEILLIIALITFIEFTKYLMVRDILFAFIGGAIGGARRFSMPIWFEIIGIIIVYFLASLVYLKLNMWVIKRKKLQQRVGGTFY